MAKIADLRQQQALTKFLETLISGAGQVYGGVRKARREREFGNLLEDITGGKIKATERVEVPYRGAGPVREEGVSKIQAPFVAEPDRPVQTIEREVERVRTPDEQAKAVLSLILRCPDIEPAEKLKSVLTELAGRRKGTAELAKEERQHGFRMKEKAAEFGYKTTIAGEQARVRREIAEASNKTRQEIAKMRKESNTTISNLRGAADKKQWSEVTKFYKTLVKQREDLFEPLYPEVTGWRDIITDEPTQKQLDAYDIELQDYESKRDELDKQIQQIEEKYGELIEGLSARRPRGGAGVTKKRTVTSRGGGPTGF